MNAEGTALFPILFFENGNRGDRFHFLNRSPPGERKRGGWQVRRSRSKDINFVYITSRDQKSINQIAFVLKKKILFLFMKKRNRFRISEDSKKIGKEIDKNS